MDIKLAKLLCECNDEFSLRENYSGRGMFGEKTAGVVCPSVTDLLSCVLAVPDWFLDEDGYPMFDDVEFSCDNMGTDYIVY